MTRRRWLMAGGTGLTLLFLSFAALVRYTDIGAPSVEYMSVPEPCALIHEPSANQLAGSVTRTEIFHSGPGRTGRGLTREAARRDCYGTPVDPGDGGAVRSSVMLFYSAQFHLGRTGEETAADQFADQIELMRELSFEDGCAYELHSDRGNACGMRDESRVYLIIQRGNLFADISVRFRDARGPYGQEALRPDAGELHELMGALGEHALSRLDGGLPEQRGG